MDKYLFSRCPVNLLWCDKSVSKAFNLYKTNLES